MHKISVCQHKILFINESARFEKNTEEIFSSTSQTRLSQTRHHSLNSSINLTVKNDEDLSSSSQGEIDTYFFIGRLDYIHRCMLKPLGNASNYFQWYHLTSERDRRVEIANVGIFLIREIRPVSETWCNPPAVNNDVKSLPHNKTDNAMPNT